jgi:hypothetical protein
LQRGNAASPAKEIVDLGQYVNLVIHRLALLDGGRHFTRAEISLMRRVCAIACLLAALSFGSERTLAFQEEKPPSAEASAAAPQAPALQLGTPATAEGTAQTGSQGLKLFGYTVLPKLNFGLDVLYGQDEEQLQLQGPTTLEENGDVTVLGKVKRRF